MGHLPKINSLRDCGLLKLFMVPNMTNQTFLLFEIIHWWDVDTQQFIIGPELFSIDMEDIYFLTWLSSQGALAVLSGAWSTSEEIVQSLKWQHCREGVQREKDKIYIKDIEDLTLQTLAYTIIRVAGTQALHIVTKPHLELCIICLEPTFFNWCEGMLMNVKSQLMKMKRSRN